MIQNCEHLNIIRVKNKLNDGIQNLHLNVMFGRYGSLIIGEIQIKIGKKPIHYYAHHFLYELMRCDSQDQFR